VEVARVARDRRDLRGERHVDHDAAVERLARDARAVREHDLDVGARSLGRRRIRDLRAAVRAVAGADVALRVDANGAWDVEQAVRAIDALAPVGLELVEEPVHGVAAIRAVRARVAARIAIDETAAHEGALDAGAAHAVCLKVSRCGGISGLIAAAGVVRASGAEPYLASTLEGPVGTAAALHAAAALAASGPLPHCGLATLGLFAAIEDQLPPREGEIALPASPGLGVEPL